MDPVLVAMCVIVAVFLGYGVADFAWRSIADRRDGVIAEWEGLRLSATELIEGYSIARTLEATDAELIATVFPHPTLSEMMHEAVLDAYGRAIHF